MSQVSLVGVGICSHYFSIDEECFICGLFSSFISLISENYFHLCGAGSVEKGCDVIELVNIFSPTLKN